MSYFRQARDQYGFVVENTPTDEMRVALPTRLVGAQFGAATGLTPSTGVAGTDPNFWTGTCANSATIDQANAQVVLTSGTNNAGSAKLHSNRVARYVSGTTIGYRSVMQLGDTGTANNTRRWGVAWGATMPTITDGALFELAGTTLSAITIKGSSRNSVAVLTAPTTNATTYEIYWTNSKVYFVIGGTLVATHVASAATWANTMHHHVYMDNINAGNTTSVTLTSRVASIRRFGSDHTNPMFKNITAAATTVCKYGPGKLHALTVNIPTAASQTAILYDALSATNPIGTFELKNGIGSYTFGPTGVPFSTGLTVVTSATCDITVVYE